MKSILNHILDTYKRPTTYTILVRGSPTNSWKRIKVAAVNYKQAVNKCCELFRGKWINYSLARKMDLISARVDAAKQSRDNGKPVYIILNDDEFELSTKESGDIYARFVNGAEDRDYLEVLKERDKAATLGDKTTSDTPIKSQATTNKTIGKQINKTMETEVKKDAPVKKAAKKEVKKSVAKKVTPKKAVKKVTAKAAPKKAAKTGDAKVRSIYGIGVDLLELLKKGGNHPMETLVKKFKVENKDISFHLAAIRSNGHKVERTEKGYTLKK